MENDEDPWPPNILQYPPLCQDIADQRDAKESHICIPMTRPQLQPSVIAISGYSTMHTC